MNDSLILSARGQPLSDIRNFLGNAENELLIVAPYIKTTALDALDLPHNKKITIITTLRILDLWVGVSDINLYPYACGKSIKIFINNDIHLKAYVKDWSNCIFGSSNLSNKGLANSENFNYELNGLVNKLDIETIIYLKKILTNSKLMDDSLYDAVKSKIDLLPEKIEIEEIDLSLVENEKDYLISSLPMSNSIEDLYALVMNGYKSQSAEAVNCAIHDCILFEIPPDISFDEFLTHLKKRFFSLKFIKDLLNYIDQKERYFGSVKEWIQSNCADVPLPSRRDLTGNIQVLYKWIVYLSEGEYLVDRPNHSERIYRSRNE